MTQLLAKCVQNLPGSAPRSWSVVFQESEADFPCLLPQLQPRGKSRSREGNAGVQGPYLPFSLQTLGQFWHDARGLSLSISYTSPDAFLMYQRRLEGNTGYGVQANLVSQEFCRVLLCLRISGTKLYSRLELSQFMCGSGDSRIKQRGESRLLSAHPLHSETCV